MAKIMKHIKEDTTGLTQEITLWIMHYAQSENRRPPFDSAFYHMTHERGYQGSPLLKRLIKIAFENVSSMPTYQQIMNPKNNQNNELLR